MILNEEIKLIVAYSERIDKYISDNTDMARNEVKSTIIDYSVLVDGIEVRKPKFIVKENQEIIITKKINNSEYDIKPEKIDLDIVFEDDDIVVINKPSGMVVHPAPGNMNKTLVNALLYHFKDLSDLNGSIRPGIVHRIDKDTSGLLIVAKNNKAHRYFADEIKKHNVNREYIALVDGIINHKTMHINLPIGRSANDRQKMIVTKTNSKEAVTHVHLLETYKKNSLVHCVLETGRTHQIRVHLNYIKNPVTGDPVYGKKIDDFNQRLHAFKLSFKHINGKELTFEVKEPKEFYKNIELN